MERFQYFGEFDSFKVTGCSKLAQWIGKTKNRYNAFARHANQWLLQPESTAHIYLALNELSRLARLRLYELTHLDDEEFDINDDGPGSADFICSFACEFFHSAYLARTQYVIWQCLSQEFSCLEEPHHVISNSSSIISNRSEDEKPWRKFCDMVESMLHDPLHAKSVLGEDAHSWFLSIYDERLYEFEASWVIRREPVQRKAVTPIFADHPAEGYEGAMSYSLRQWSLSRDGGFRLEDVLRVAREE